MASKFYEDLMDAYSENIPIGYTPIILPQTQSELSGIKLIDCIYEFCKYQFKSFPELQDHLLNYHNINFYIKIDEIIADEITICASLPQNIHLNNSSSNDTINVEVYHNNNELLKVTLKPLSYFDINSTNIKEGKYEFRIYPLQKLYIIYLNQIPDFKSDDLDPILMKYINLYYENKINSWRNDKITENYWSNFLGEIQLYNDLYQRKYLNGIYEYLFGLYLEENNNKLSKTHYENSFSYLRLFKVKLAVTITRALALKMNLFSILKNSSKKSIFYGSNIFYNTSYKELMLIVNSNKYSGLFVDDILSDAILLDIRNSFLLKAIHSFLVKDYGLTHNLVNQIINQNQLLSDDVLFNVKFNLLRARLKRVTNKNEEAREIYKELAFYLEEPNIIKEEINEYLNE